MYVNICSLKPDNVKPNAQQNPKSRKKVNSAKSMFKVTKHRLMFTEYEQLKIGVSLKSCQISKTQWKNTHVNK